MFGVGHFNCAHKMGPFCNLVNSESEFSLQGVGGGRVALFKFVWSFTCDVDFSGLIRG